LAHSLSLNAAIVADDAVLTAEREAARAAHEKAKAEGKGPGPGYTLIEHHKVRTKVAGAGGMPPKVQSEPKPMKAKAGPPKYTGTAEELKKAYEED
jgi:hypothetical protein